MIKFVGFLLLISLWFLGLSVISLDSWTNDIGPVFVRRRIHIGENSTWTPFAFIYWRKEPEDKKVIITKYGEKYNKPSKTWFHLLE